MKMSVFLKLFNKIKDNIVARRIIEPDQVDVVTQTQ